MPLVVVPNFVLHGPTCDAEAPAHSFVRCADGFAGLDDPENPAKQAHFSGCTTAQTEIVAALLREKGPAIERVWAARILMVGDPPHSDPRRCPHVFATLWHDPCPGCGRSHTFQALKWQRAAKNLHPGALEALREANPPLHLLLDPDVPTERRLKEKGNRKSPPGLPVRATNGKIDDEATLRAQKMFAKSIIAKRAHPRVYVPGGRRSPTVGAPEGRE